MRRSDRPRPRRSPSSSVLVLLLTTSAALLSSCTGTLGDAPPDPGPSAAALCATGDLPGPHPRLVRLTHAQYDNTVRELLGQPTAAPSADFIGDPEFTGFVNNAASLLVSDRLARDYRRAAEALGALIADPAAMQPLVPCDVASGDSACAEAFIRKTARRAYRRSLAPDEVAGLLALYARGNGLFKTGTPFQQGIRHFVEALLQSPKFLYRIELSQAPSQGPLIPLTGYEVATRLSYLLWNSLPDEALLAAAESGTLLLDDGLEAEARRMLADPRAVGPIDDFHAQWLQVSRYDNLTKDETLFPDFNGPAMSTAMHEETRRFIRHVALDLSGSYQDLLLSRTTFVNDKLASIYGLPGTFGAEFTQVELDENERAGLLTHAGFLASHAYKASSSPIHRGVFVQRRLLCDEIPPPSGQVDTTLPPPSGDIKTTKQQVENKTSPQNCAACHTRINPPGFALETFDAQGGWRTTDNGEPVDPTGSFKLDGKQVDVNGPIELANLLATSEHAQSCYLKQWYRYGFARQETAADKCTLAALDAKFAKTGYNIKEILVAFALTKTFRFRIAEEVSR